MPDLLTHVGVAYVCRRWVPTRSLTLWFLIGAVLPDLLTRPVNILLPDLTWFVMPLHTPVGLALVCVLISGLFEPARQRSVLGNLLGGAALHVLLDMFQKHITGGYYLFFPFSWRSYEIGVVWPETSLYLLPLWLGLGLYAAMRAVTRWRAATIRPREGAADGTAG